MDITNGLRMALKNYLCIFVDIRFAACGIDESGRVLDEGAYVNRLSLASRIDPTFPWLEPWPHAVFCCERAHKIAASILFSESHQAANTAFRRVDSLYFRTERGFWKEIFLLPFLMARLRLNWLAAQPVQITRKSALTGNNSDLHMLAFHWYTRVAQSANILSFCSVDAAKYSAGQKKWKYIPRIQRMIGETLEDASAEEREIANRLSGFVISIPAPGILPIKPLARRTPLRIYRQISPQPDQQF